MSRWKALLKIVGICLGGIGVVVCAVAIVVIWTLSIRVGTAIESLFSRVDQSFVVVGEWGGQVKDRIAAAAITTDDLEKTLQNWTKRQASERLATRLDAVQKAERLASGLRQADQLLEMSASSVGLVRQLLSTGATAGAPPTRRRSTNCLRRLNRCGPNWPKRRRLSAKSKTASAERAKRIRPKLRVEAALRFGLRVAATLHSFGSRLEKLADRISAAQNRLHELNARVQRWRLYLTAGITALMVWMAAGQVALCRQARSAGCGN